MLLLSVQNLSFKEEGRTAIEDISFDQLPLQRIAIAGETGSGKTSLLKMIAGLLQPTSGAIFLNNERVVGPDEQLLPGHPGIAFLSQHFELRNNYKVKDWLAMANKLTPSSAMQVYKVCRVDHLLERKNEALSGGEKQRIALARLLTMAPKLLLLDEPFSNLDRIHKQLIKTVIHEIGQKLNTSCILVSHDTADLLSWADLLLVIKDGKIIQQGTPRELYYYPMNEYVAGLLGDYNLIDLAKYPFFKKMFMKEMPDKRIMIRPEQIQVSKDSDIGVPVIIEQINFHGNYFELLLSTNGINISCYSAIGKYNIGDQISISINL
ncbi:MAG: ABC transporter ATP-binding protein [Sediminibacterium sp.]|jgi:ABC-type sugar transport system ATPase subunit|nr:ABC transporter ATP-binding protein [Chitinophagaceae bacterium]MCA6448124.1 ABC transporter ATP-binding protein [Chitinophagaceae bacterium]